MLSFAFPDTPYAVILGFDEHGRLFEYYINLESPLRPSVPGYDTVEHLLDVTIPPDRSSWTWKDEDELVEAVQRGLFTEEDADRFRFWGERAVEHVLLRDYLRIAPDATALYADVKREAARAHPDDRVSYQASKAQVIATILDQTAEVTPTLTAGQVMLDGHRATDARAHLDGEDKEHARRFGWWPERSTLASVTAAIRRWQHHWVVGGHTRAFAVRDAHEGTLVGGCELRFTGPDVAEISYWTFPAKRRRGLATRAVRLARDFAFDELGAARMEARIEPDNHASRTVVERAGLAEEGVLRDAGVSASGRHDLVLYAAPPRDR